MRSWWKPWGVAVTRSRYMREGEGPIVRDIMGRHWSHRDAQAHAARLRLLLPFADVAVVERVWGIRRKR